MESWPLELEVARDGEEPLFLSISRAIAAAIRGGRLAPGSALPGSRTLAVRLRVHRNTVLSALRELENEGWLETTPAKGTFVRRELPDVPARSLRGLSTWSRDPSRVAFDLRGAPLSPDTVRHHSGPAIVGRPKHALPLFGGVPDLRLVPTGALARAYRRALSVREGSPLGYGDPYGDPRLRRTLAEMLERVRGIAHAERGLVVTRGSQMALFLAARAVLAPGDVVAVEALGYRPAWEAFRLAGARVAAVPVDAHGLKTHALAELCAKHAVRAVYVTPHHQYPTTAMLSPARRLELLELARARGFAIVEDDYDHEFHYDGRPALPIASADARGSVIYVGTLSKILAPGLRLGFLVAPEAVAARVAELRTVVDRQGDHAVERAVADLLEDGEIQRHSRRMRRVYHARRDAMVKAATRHLGDVLSFRVPQGGLAIWARVSRSIDVEAWAERAERQGVLLQTGRRFTFDGRAHPSLRLGYAPVDEDEIEAAVRKLAQTARVTSAAARPSAARRRSA